MPFVRFSRDKRGYEHICLVHSSSRRGKPSRSRVLYWFRTPPGVRVGREAFDEGARRLLEAQYPDLTFDWEALAATPIPPPVEVEPWRERRRAQRAAKRWIESDDSDVPPVGLVEEPSVEPEPTAEAPRESIGSATSVEPSARAVAGPARRRRRGGRRRKRPTAGEHAAGAGVPEEMAGETPGEASEEVPEGVDDTAER